MSMINKKKLKLMRELGQHALSKNPSLHSYHQLHSIEMLTTSVSEIRKDFKSIAFMGPYPEYFFHKLTKTQPEKIFIIDYSTHQLARAREALDKIYPPGSNVEKYFLIADHDLWPFKPETLDLIVDNLTIHLSTSMEISMKRLLVSLEPDGAMIGNAYGSSTLKELRSAFYLAENERTGGISPRTLKFSDMTSLGNLMSRCGYQLTSFHTNLYDEFYDSPWYLMDH
jgi:NADH dehydrogenase [ubiquinone] 1 alpha subcomplex assembly factor 5